MRYKLLEDDTIVAQGTGETIDIASSGVAFTTGQPLRPGAYIELSISWPVLLDENTRMRLVIFGRLVRSNKQTAACTVERYEFRTQARATTAVFEIRKDTMLQRWAEELRKGVMKTRTLMA